MSSGAGGLAGGCPSVVRAGFACCCFLACSHPRSQRWVTAVSRFKPTGLAGGEFRPGGSCVARRGRFATSLSWVRSTWATPGRQEARGADSGFMARHWAAEGATSSRPFVPGVESHLQVSGAPPGQGAGRDKTAQFRSKPVFSSSCVPSSLTSSAGTNTADFHVGCCVCRGLVKCRERMVRMTPLFFLRMGVSAQLGSVVGKCLKSVNRLYGGC